MSDNNRNWEHYYDPTASKAVNSIADKNTKEIMDIDEQSYLIIKGIKLLLKAAGFQLLGRIEIVHKKSGRVYK